MFQFNFQIEQPSEDLSSKVDEKVVLEDPNVQCHEEFPRNLLHEDHFNSLTVSNMKFMIRNLDSIQTNPDLKFLECYKNCDVVPTVYEGGLKVWECTFDLLSFLIRTKIDFSEKKVLDLGCGCGLLGIFAGLQGAALVHFQDYNVEVLNNVTIPNVLKNNVKSETRFFSGDWGSFASSNIPNIKYDYILSSEILYNIRNYQKLVNVFLEKLSDKGEVMIASKSYYFGVGGTVKQFENFLREQDIFKCHSVWQTADGVQREILVVEK